MYNFLIVQRNKLNLQFSKKKYKTERFGKNKCFFCNTINKIA
jgi:hypothetical protein